MRTLLLLLGLLSGSYGHAQNFTVRNHYRNVSSSYFIHKVENDIWVGSDGGAVYFDQNKQEKGYYTILNSGLKNNDVAAVLTDFDGDLWIGTFGGGVSRYHQGIWEVYDNITSVFSSGYVLSMALDSMGVVWVGTNNGLVSYDGTNWTNYNGTAPAPKNDYINSITVAPDGKVWIGTLGSGVFSFSHSGGWTKYDANTYSYLATPINDIEIGRDSTVWIATYGKGLIRFKDGNWSIFSGLPSDFLWALAINPDGGVWVGSNGGGLYLYENAQWSFYDKANSGISSDLIDALYCDDQGAVWCCNVFGSVDVFNGNTWEYLKMTSIYDGNIKELWYDKANTMYVRNELGVILSINNGKVDSVFDAAKDFYPFAFTIGPPGSTLWGVASGLANTKLAKRVGQNWVIDQDISVASQEPATDFAIDKNGVKWVAKYGHLYKVQNNQLVPVNYTGGSDITGLKFDANNVLWLTNYGDGVFYFDGNAWNRYDMSNSVCPSNAALSLAIDQQNNKWIGTTAGILFISASGALSVFDHSNSPSKDGVVYDMDIAPDGSVWIADWQQVLQFKNGVFYSYPTAERIPDSGCPSGVSDFIRALRVDNTYRIWLGTNCNGILEIEPQFPVSTENKATQSLVLETWPNPNSGEFYLKTTHRQGLLLVFDVAGRVIHEERNPAGLIRLSNRQNGLYYLQFITDQAVYQSSFMLSGN